REIDRNGESQQTDRCSDPQVAPAILQHIVDALEVHLTRSAESAGRKSLAVELINHRPPSAGAQATRPNLRNPRHVVVPESVRLSEADGAVPGQPDGTACVGADPDVAGAVLGD